jgi:alpha-amylase/alpha-mannosidase (GH57 family)
MLTALNRNYSDSVSFVISSHVINKRKGKGITVPVLYLSTNPWRRIVGVEV